MTTLDVIEYDVFAAAPGGGNPCPVVLDAGELGTAQMQSLAARYGVETGFVVAISPGTVRLRYFVPRHEMSMCVHATVAAVTALAESGQISGGRTTVRTDSGDCAISWTAGEVTVEQQPPVFGPLLDVTGDLAVATGLPASAFGSPVRSVSVSRPKLMVAVHAAADVHQAAPDYPALWALCRELDTTGAYLYAHPEPGQVVARQFPVEVGYPEDPATGVAAGALAAHLADLAGAAVSIEIEQGTAMGRPSRLHASAQPGPGGVSTTEVSGTATERSRTRVNVE